MAIQLQKSAILSAINEILNLKAAVDGQNGVLKKLTEGGTSGQCSGDVVNRLSELGTFSVASGWAISHLMQATVDCLTNYVDTMDTADVAISAAIKGEE